MMGKNVPGSRNNICKAKRLEKALREGKPTTTTGTKDACGECKETKEKRKTHTWLFSQ